MSSIHPRSVVFGWAIGIALLSTPDRASALTCYTPPPTEAAWTATGVFEATIAARRPLDPLVFRVLEWLGEPVMNLTDRFELALQDVEPLRGSAPRTIRTGYSYLAPGSRHLFIVRRRWTGHFIVGPCVGYVIEASEATALKSWIASLSEPPAGGRLFGTVYARWSSSHPEASVPTGGARVTIRGPVVVETITDGAGQFGFTGLPDGRYDVSAVAVGPMGTVGVSQPVTEVLGGDHAAAQLLLFATPSR
jgi:hypothetical protein